MLIAIARFFGWDRAAPVRSTLAAKPGRPATIGKKVMEKSTIVAMAPVAPAAAHHDAKDAGGSNEVEPATVVLRTEAVQTMPEEVSSVLSPVDPVTHPPAEAAGSVTTPIRRPRKSRVKATKMDKREQSVEDGVQVSCDNLS